MPNPNIAALNAVIRLQNIEGDLQWLSEQDQRGEFNALDTYYGCQDMAARARQTAREKLVRERQRLTRALDIVDADGGAELCPDCGEECEPDAPMLCWDCTNDLRLRRLAAERSMNRRAEMNWFERWGETQAESERKERERAEAEANTAWCAWCGDVQVDRRGNLCLECAASGGAE